MNLSMAAAVTLARNPCHGPLTSRRDWSEQERGNEPQQIETVMYYRALISKCPPFAKEGEVVW